jgi:CBS domain-containing protein
MNVAAILKAKGRAVATAKPDTSIVEIAGKLASKRIGAIVIVGSSGKVEGIISERDLVRAIAEAGEKALHAPVSEFMTRNVVPCQETTTLDELMGVMTKGRFRHLPVIEDGALTGIISIGDVVKHHVAEVEMEVTAMREYLATG